MPQEPLPQKYILSTAITQTLGSGRTFPTVANKVQNPATPVSNPPVLVGVDVITVTLPASGTASVTSPNIPARSSSLVPSNVSAIPVQGTSALIMTVSVQSGRADCVPFATDIGGLVHAGSIQRNVTLKSFGSKISGTPGESVTIALTVYFQR